MKRLLMIFAIIMFLIVIAITNSEETNSNNKNNVTKYDEVFTVNTATPVSTSKPTPTKNPIKVAKKKVNKIGNKIEKILKNSASKKTSDETSNDKASKRLKKLFIRYKATLKKNNKLLDPPETIYDCFSKEDIEYISRTVETETYQQNIICKANVASTVLSRYEHGEYGDSIKEIVTSPNQFVCGRTTITKETKLAVELAFMFKTKYDGSLYFQSANYMKSFNGADYMGFDGCHYFYK